MGKALTTAKRTSLLLLTSSTRRDPKIGKHQFRHLLEIPRGKTCRRTRQLYRRRL